MGVRVWSSSSRVRDMSWNCYEGRSLLLQCITSDPVGFTVPVLTGPDVSETTHPFFPSPSIVRIRLGPSVESVNY